MPEPTRLEHLSPNASNLRVECSCGHVGVIDLARLCRWFALHRWESDLAGSVPARLRCTRCGGRAKRMSATRERPTAPDRFPNNEAGWEQRRRRLRD